MTVSRVKKLKVNVMSYYKWLNFCLLKLFYKKLQHFGGTASIVQNNIVNLLGNGSSYATELCRWVLLVEENKEHG